MVNDIRTASKLSTTFSLIGLSSRHIHDLLRCLDLSLHGVVHLSRSDRLAN